MTTNRILNGSIESVRFTSGSFGEQYVTIDGTEYMSHWEIDQLKIGARVQVRVLPPLQNCWIGNSQIVFSQAQAQFIQFLDNGL